MKFLWIPGHRVIIDNITLYLRLVRLILNIIFDGWVYFEGTYVDARGWCISVDISSSRTVYSMTDSTLYYLSEHLQSSNLQNPGSQTPTPPPSHLINFPFSSVMQGSFEIHRGCIILVRPFLHSISLKKNKLTLNLIYPG